MKRINLKTITNALSKKEMMQFRGGIIQSKATVQRTNPVLVMEVAAEVRDHAMQHEIYILNLLLHMYVFLQQPRHNLTLMVIIWDGGVVDVRMPIHIVSRFCSFGRKYFSRKNFARYSFPLKNEMEFRQMYFFPIFVPINCISL